MILSVELLNKLMEDRTLSEIWIEDESNKSKYFRYIIPLSIKQPCLDCHGGPKGEIDIAGYSKRKGFQLGDFGGNINTFYSYE
ncbi:DUF3365 domain-containing protein [Anaerobacillus sp. HL2]|nr:DUF3365 domain-containing protein [Anaerobacillus sp. HL2]